MIQTILIAVLIVVISALIGWLTNMIAVKMIFRPRHEVNILGIRFIGLIPKRRADLAVKIADTVEKELISHRDIHAILQTPEFHQNMVSVIKSKLETFIADMVKTNQLLTMFVKPDMISRMSDFFMEELEKLMPEMIDSLFESVENKIDFKAIIRSRIESYDLVKLESIIQTIASQELKAIEVIGGVIGGIIGLVQVGIMLAGRIHG